LKGKVSQATLTLSCLQQTVLATGRSVKITPKGRYL